MTAYVILAWGSLLWSPRTLAMASEWTLIGPTLPIEFSRVARDGRLSLIVDAQHGAACGTWACDSPLSLEEAIANLAEREQCDVRWIGSVDRSGPDPRLHSRGLAAGAILNWCEERGVAGALWTAPPSTFRERTGHPFSAEAAILYLDSLRGATRDRAFEYVRKAPPTTVTPVRLAFDERWPGSSRDQQ